MDWTYYCMKCKKWTVHKLDRKRRGLADPPMLCQECRGRHSSGKLSYASSVSAAVMQNAFEAGLIDEQGEITRDICTCSGAWGWGLHNESCPVYVYHASDCLKAEKVLQRALATSPGGSR